MTHWTSRVISGCAPMAISGKKSMDVHVWLLNDMKEHRANERQA
jgi:hypothetical protein